MQSVSKMQKSLTNVNSIPDSLINATMRRDGILSNYEMRRKKQRDKSKNKSFWAQDWRNALNKAKNKSIKNQLIQKVMDGCLLDLTDPYNEANNKEVKSPQSAIDERRLKREENLKNSYDATWNLK